MEKCTCSNCNKPFFYDPNLVSYQTKEFMLGHYTEYKKIVHCPYCGLALLLDRYRKPWE